MKNMDPSVALGEQEISCTIFESNVKNLESRSAGRERGALRGRDVRLFRAFEGDGSFETRGKVKKLVRLAGSRERGPQ